MTNKQNVFIGGKHSAAYSTCLCEYLSRLLLRLLFVTRDEYQDSWCGLLRSCSACHRDKPHHVVNDTDGSPRLNSCRVPIPPLKKIRAELAWVNEPVDPNVLLQACAVLRTDRACCSASVRTSRPRRCGAGVFLLELPGVSLRRRCIRFSGKR